MNPALGIGEKAFQAQIRQLLALYGYRVYHTRYSLGSDPGFPDLVAVRPGRIVFLELKTERGKVRPEQEVWLAALSEGGAEAYLVRPSGWDQMVEVLR